MAIKTEEELEEWLKERTEAINEMSFEEIKSRLEELTVEQTLIMKELLVLQTNLNKHKRKRQIH